jgi:hypothetical protein
MKLAGLVLLVACVEPAAPTGLAVESRVEIFAVPQPSQAKLDVLFVVDNSARMQPHQERFLAAAPDFMQSLLINSEPTDLHVGIVTTDLGGGSGCSREGDAGRLVGFLRDRLQIDGTHATSFDGSLASTFTALVDVGLAGCPTAKPLEAMERALAANPSNAGFRRLDATLAIVIVSAGDDQSFIDVTHFVTFLRSVEPGRLFLTVIASGETPRLQAFRTKLAGAHNTSSATLERETMADAFVFPTGWGTSVGNPCASSDLVDLEPSKPDLQGDCSFEDIRFWTRDNERRQILSSCETGELPCWRFIQDDRLCPPALGRPEPIIRGLMLAIDRADWALPNTMVVGQCLAL